MENQNQNPIPPATSIPQGVPVPVTPPVKPNPIDQLKTKFNSLPKNSKMIAMLVAVLFSIIFILFLLVLLFGKKQNTPVVIKTPDPILVTPAPNIILNASRYATDSGVLKIEEDLNGFQKQLNSSDVKQSDLNQPNLNFDINFNSN
ncbi:hypothetical protein BH10PAT1_BH10PAT1_0630 [soil metagenome]